MVAPAPAPAPESAPAPEKHSFNAPPCPLPPELRSDIAYRRAQGSSWDAVGVVFKYHPDALRRAAENDPAFAAAQERAWAEVAWEGEADGMRRLRFLANGCDDDRAARAAEVLVKYARERRRDDTRLAAERIKSDTKLAVEAAKTERNEPAEPEECPPPAPKPQPESAEARAARLYREHAAEAAQPGAEVYLWGGKHPTGQCVGPDETDTRVRLVPDWSCGRGSRMIVYWVVPESAREHVPGTGIIDPPGDEPPPP